MSKNFKLCIVRFSFLRLGVQPSLNLRWIYNVINENCSLFSHAFHIFGYELSLIALDRDAHFKLIGHIRPFCILATRLVLEQENVVITLMVAPHVLDKTRSEVSRQFINEPSKAQALQRIR